ncbi:Cos111p KNAG_0A03760 [Huiozyma naganishii CBS 8797]|uniref:Uncharacterized protein n=1 Tax=Huiozyma naganishii (strain ATCC MYA-139 / BCRC 22969 / CBS 8797 / KCTC 17520 / NBRC 10181 / NCYC 3082 / Yp74L-3) TaxID=1071383 RepID=J7S3M1_HUIN7|nr:hypothetical protein KNAG_0A03760 [Kazachstania naganishii CBS 8797]CCK68056.1 hypothetical protein KNAG_0A03760 [Kazachstania naganishii CBS 8797]
MTGSRLQNINIVGNNYSRYGTSVYQNLYGDTSHSKTATTVTGTGAAKGSMYKRPSANKLGQVASNEDNESIPDNATIGTNTSRTSLIKRKYKSLISSSSKKLIGKLYEHGSSDSFSIFSSKSHSYYNGTSNNFVSGDKSRIGDLDLEVDRIIFDEKFADINDLPVELLSRIIFYIDTSVCDDEEGVKLDKKNNDEVVDILPVLCCLYLNKKFYEAAKVVLYREPYFRSTYRVAQFVTSIRLHPENGAYVRVLDLSHLKNGLIFNVENCEPSTAVQRNSFISIPDRLVAFRTGETSGTTSSAIVPGPDPQLPNGSASESRPASAPEPLKDIAYAGWRDWRHRNDPLYSSPVLNSYNLKKVVSRSSSIHSASCSLTTTTNETNSSTANVSLGNSNRARSNSSVSSITSSIMSSFQNGSHISLNSSFSSHTASTNPQSSSVINENTIEDDKKGRCAAGLEKQRLRSKNDTSKWQRFKMATRGKRKIKNNTQLLGSENKTEKNDKNVGSDSNLLANHRRMASVSQVRFCENQPFKTNHPYTNKFLLKHALYRDLPLGYILHLLKHCPNLTELNLSNLVLFQDFQILEKKPHHKRFRSLVLPAVKESAVMNSACLEDVLDVVYATDSSKNYEQLDQFQNSKNYKRRSSSGNSISGINPNHWVSSNSVNWGDYPQPIDGHTKMREIKNGNNKNLELKKLDGEDIFQYICSGKHMHALETIKMDGIVWCRQSMVRAFLLVKLNEVFSTTDTLGQLQEQRMNLSFVKSGMNRNFAWACRGTFNDIITLLILDELSKMDQSTIENIFNIKSDRLHPAKFSSRDPDITEISNVFCIKYGFKNEEQGEMNFRLTVLKSERPTSYKLSRMSRNHISLVIRLRMDENYNSVAKAEEGLPKDAEKRINRLTHSIVARVRSLRCSDLRRNIGENSYLGS